MPDHPCFSSPLLTTSSLVESLSELVAINSVNPGYGGPEVGERRVIEWVAQRLEAAGLVVQLSEALPGRPNLRVRLEGKDPARGIMFQTHVDTVSTTGMTVEPHRARIVDGRLEGRGSVDAKAQVVCMLHALLAWVESGERPPQSIELVLCVDEEHGMLGSKYFAGESFEGIDAIVVGEPTLLQPVIAHKGRLVWSIEFAGRAVHSSVPSLGVSAISSAGAFISMVDRSYLPELRGRKAPMLNSPTFNMAVIEGGVQGNLVPPSCRLDVERRTLPGENWESVRGEVEALFERLRTVLPNFKATQSEPLFDVDGMQTPLEHPFVAHVENVLVGQKRVAQPQGVDYCTDASRLGGLGLPIVVLGPGSIDQAHTADEFVEIEQLTAGARVYAALMGEALPEF